MDRVTYRPAVVFVAVFVTVLLWDVARNGTLMVGTAALFGVAAMIAGAVGAQIAVALRRRRG